MGKSLHEGLIVIVGQFHAWSCLSRIGARFPGALNRGDFAGRKDPISDSADPFSRFPVSNPGQEV